MPLVMRRRLEGRSPNTPSLTKKKASRVLFLKIHAICDIIIFGVGDFLTLLFFFFFRCCRREFERRGRSSVFLSASTRLVSINDEFVKFLTPVGSTIHDRAIIDWAKEVDERNRLREAPSVSLKIFVGSNWHISARQIAVCWSMCLLAINEMLTVKPVSRRHGVDARILRRHPAGRPSITAW